MLVKNLTLRNDCTLIPSAHGTQQSDLSKRSKDRLYDAQLSPRLVACTQTRTRLEPLKARALTSTLRLHCSNCFVIWCNKVQAFHKRTQCTNCRTDLKKILRVTTIQNSTLHDIKPNVEITHLVEDFTPILFFSYHKTTRNLISKPYEIKDFNPTNLLKNHLIIVLTLFSIRITCYFPLIVDQSSWTTHIHTFTHL